MAQPQTKPEPEDTPPRRVKKIEHPAFARRMAQACDGNSDVPPPNYGRLQWFVDQLDAAGMHSTPESVRKWFAGEALPRPKTMRVLAEILKVDEAWLSLGHAPELDQRQQKLRNAEADGVVNVVAGFIQMCGSSPAFPAANDKRAHVDVYAIIKGAQYAIHVSLEKDGKYIIPVGAEENFVVGVLRTDDLECQFYEVNASAGKRKGGFIEVESAGQKRIRTFAERL